MKNINIAAFKAADNETKIAVRETAKKIVAGWARYEQFTKDPNCSKYQAAGLDNIMSETEDEGSLYYDILMLLQENWESKVSGKTEDLNDLIRLIV